MTTSSTAWHSLAGALLAALAVCLPTDGLAASDEAVAVLPAGGIERASIYSLTGTADDLQAERTGALQLVTDDLAPAAFTDLKVLAGGGHLVTDFADRGVATTDSQGAVGFSLGEPGDYPGIAAASVAAYDEDARPVHILYADDDRRQIAIRDLRAGTDIWRKPITAPNAPAEFAQVIALPGHRIAAAIEWPSRQLSGIDLFDLSKEGADKFVLRLASASHDNAPEPTAALAALRGIRDIFGLGEDRLLVTTRSKLLVIDLAARQITRRVSIADHPELGGEFISARALPSGHIAAATIEPGLWTRPHANHRIAWFDSNLQKLIADYGPLDRAPWRIEAAVGHGASGTLGLEPGLEFVPSGGPDDLQVASPVDLRPIPVRKTSGATAEVRLANSTNRPIYLERVAITASPDGCEAETHRRRLVERVGLALPPAANIGISGTFQLGADAPTGQWCVRLEVTDAGGQTTILPPPLRFEVISPNADAGTSTGNVVEPIDLDLRTADAGRSGADTESSGPGQLGGGGCGCDAGGQGSPVGSGMLWGLVVVGIAVRRQS